MDGEEEEEEEGTNEVEGILNRGKGKKDCIWREEGTVDDEEGDVEGQS